MYRFPTGLECGDVLSCPRRLGGTQHMCMDVTQSYQGAVRTSQVQEFKAGRDSQG